MSLNREKISDKDENIVILRMQSFIKAFKLWYILDTITILYVKCKQCSKEP